MSRGNDQLHITDLELLQLVAKLVGLITFMLPISLVSLYLQRLMLLAFCAYNISVQSITAQLQPRTAFVQQFCTRCPSCLEFTPTHNHRWSEHLCTSYFIPDLKHSSTKGPISNHSVTLTAPAIHLIGRHTTFLNLFTYSLTYLQLQQPANYYTTCVLYEP